MSEQRKLSSSALTSQQEEKCFETDTSRCLSVLKGERQEKLISRNSHMKVRKGDDFSDGKRKRKFNGTAVVF